MSNLINSVWSLANKFMDDGSFVTTNFEKISKVAENINNQKNNDIDHMIRGGYYSNGISLDFPKCIKSIDMPESYKLKKLFLYDYDFC